MEIAERDYSDPSEEMEFAGSSPLSIYRNTVLYWRGFVVADLYSDSFTAPPYEVARTFRRGGSSLPMGRTMAGICPSAMSSCSYTMLQWLKEYFQRSEKVRT